MPWEAPVFHWAVDSQARTGMLRTGWWGWVAGSASGPQPARVPGCAGARHASKLTVVGHGEVPSQRVGAISNQLWHASLSTRQCPNRECPCFLLASDRNAPMFGWRRFELAAGAPPGTLTTTPGYSCISAVSGVRGGAGARELFEVHALQLAFGEEGQEVRNSRSASACAWWWCW